MSYLLTRSLQRSAALAGSGPRLVHGKLAPPPGAAQVDRERLRRVLDEWPRHRVTLVCAPAGYGKTSLAAAWAAGQPAGAPAAWVSLGRADRDPHRFWSYALTALRRAGALPGGRRRYTGTANRELLAVLESLRRPVALVLDDADWIAGTATARSLARCVRYGNPLHLVLCSRVEPPMPRWMIAS